PGRYVHLSGRDIDIEYARLHGIVDEEAPKESKLTPKPCPRCRAKIAPIMKYCPQCAMLIDPQMATEEALYGKMDDISREKMLDAMRHDQKIDLRLLAKLVAQEMKQDG
ncbi:MAG: hypothetical protein QCI38_03200, partial [Candidatus Thermoplasmatota archaeon]|nr:hypothetical protein [Candidatus Thermoplasmatota archaeon]